MKRVKTITSYAGEARFLAGVKDTRLVIESARLPRQPYRYSLATPVYREGARLVAIVEVGQRRSEVWALDADECRKRTRDD